MYRWYLNKRRMKLEMREIFEQTTLPNFSKEEIDTTRLANGQYRNPIVEDHWQTFQEGWEEGIKWFKQSVTEY